eukprot:1159427-Pelagomonas_calceolata.AAC.6
MPVSVQEINIQQFFWNPFTACPSNSTQNTLPLCTRSFIPCGFIELDMLAKMMMPNEKGALKAYMHRVFDPHDKLDEITIIFTWNYYALLSGGQGQGILSFTARL